MTYQKLARALNKIEPGLYGKYKVNAAKQGRRLNLVEYALYDIILYSFDWNNATIYPDSLKWSDVYNILFRERWKTGITKYKRIT